MHCKHAARSLKSGVSVDAEQAAVCAKMAKWQEVWRSSSGDQVLVLEGMIDDHWSMRKSRIKHALVREKAR